MRTNGRDDNAGYNGLVTRRECKEGVGLVVRGSIERMIGKISMSFDSLHHTLYYTFRDFRPTYLLSANQFFRLSPLSTLLPVHENIYTLPNILTLSRLIAAPVVGYLIINDLHIPALGLFAYAGITDLVDGWIARKWGLQTVLGTVIDPMADKALMTVVTVTLAMKGALPSE